MEFEQLIKRIDWLEKQQRKNSESATTVDGRLADIERDLAALVKSAAAQVFTDAVLTAYEQRAVAGAGSRLVTTLSRHPGGATRRGPTKSSAGLPCNGVHVKGQTPNMKWIAR